MHSELKIKSKNKEYCVVFVDNLDFVENEIDQPNTITFIDSNVACLYPSLGENKTSVYCINCVENVKTLSGVIDIFNCMIASKANARTKLIVIGGGILQDLVGFCASTYCRGIDYVLVPTTLLAQADSCIGGKTSINFQDKKNIVGSFYPPYKIIIYPDFTDTLTNLDFISGLGEIYKFHILQNNIEEFVYDQNIQKLIYNGLKYKSHIIEIDEYDRAERKMLNFGHTFGHAFESVSEYEVPHGVAVILGSIVAIMISKNLGYHVDKYEAIIEAGMRLLRETNIQFRKEWFDYEKLNNVIKFDKKSTGKLTMVLFDAKPVIVDVEKIDMMQPILDNLYESI